MYKVLPLIKLATLAIIFKCKLLFVRRTEKKLFIVRTDEIGDYILFRNFLQFIRGSQKFKGYKITLVGNRVWGALAEFLDAGFVDEFIWVNAADLWASDFFKTFYKRFKNERIDFLINSHTTRSWHADRICMIIPAKNKITADGTMENTSPLAKKAANFFYTGKIAVPQNIRQEFLRNRFFFEQLLAQKITLETPFINNGNWVSPASGTEGYIVIVPGASSFRKAWPTGNFAEIIKFLLVFSDFNIVLIGGKAEAAAGDEILAHVNSSRVINYIGKTSLPDVVKIMSGAVGVISNDTGSAHISAALNIKTICLLGGGHFGRFMPYAEGTSTVNCIYCKMECYGCAWKCIYKVEENGTYPCIKNIETERVKKAISTYILTGGRQNTGLLSGMQV